MVCAIENIFPGLIMDIRSDKVEAYGGPDGLKTLHELLRRQRILDSARSVMRKGLVAEAVSFQISKQAALMGSVSFPPEEEPLGSIHIQITGGEVVIDWLAPQTRDGVPVQEIELLAGEAGGPDDQQIDQQTGRPAEPSGEPQIKRQDGA